MRRAPRYKKPFGLGWFILAKPTSASGDLWDRYHQYMATNYPVRFWLQDELPTIFRRQMHKLNNAKWKVLHRTTHRYNVVKLPSLKPNYYEIDTRMLHACFDLLVEYVEIGLASRNFEWYEDRIPKNLPKFLKRFWKRRSLCAEAGLSHLDWEINDPDVRLTSPQQSETAEAVKRLYLWWKVERPERIKPFSDDMIWEGIPERKYKRVSSILSQKIPKGEEGDARRRREALDIAGFTDDFYSQQDQAMLERLIAIRSSLWT